jgi:hypothetical protein
LFFMDRGLWSLGSVLIGAAAAAIGIDWTFAVCGAVCAVAGSALFVVSRKARREVATAETAAHSHSSPPE